MKCIESNFFTSGAILAFVLLGNASFSSCFSPNAFSKKNEAARRVFQWFSESPRMTKSIETQLNASTESQTAGSSEIARDAFVKRGLASIAALGGLALGTPAPAVADEYGRETEMDFLTTGETVEICIKRGPLGKCEKTEKRTAENENDKSEKYFQKPTVVIKQKEEPDENEGNDLIARLKQRSEENAEKNEQLVYQRTLMNDAGASFGPFDGQVLILNEDGKGFTLLANPQAMRLKKAGFIQGKKFIKQPTQEEIDDALEAPKGPGFLDRFFGSE